MLIVLLNYVFIFCGFVLLSLSQHGYYSRTVVLRLLERKYKSLVSHSHNNQYLSLSTLWYWRETLHHK